MSLPRLARSWIARLEAGTSGYLDQIGWIRTRVDRAARDTAGNPIPWFTYPAIAFLSARVRPQWKVLEFGAGMGTIWWSSRVAEAKAIEHDESWANLVARQCTARLDHVTNSSPEEYISPAFGAGPYDVVIVDGIFRRECLGAALDLVTDAGVIILDDAQRPEYQPSILNVRSKGFRSIEFHGPQPVSKHLGCTEIFYRDRNVLNI